MKTRDKRTVEDRSIVHTISDLGDNMSLTREGFLLCKNVPIARIGSQDYLNEELVTGAEDDMVPGKNGVISVLREEGEVFRPETLSSFEGKDIVDDHPEDDVTPVNYKQYTVGVVLNVRRGEDEMSSFMIADLLIKDQAAIEAVRDGKREVSCGYDAEYESLGPGRARQYDIIGNHVALVDRGRCGRHCSIKDSEMKVRDKLKNGTAVGFIDRLASAFRSKDKAGFDEAMEHLKDELGVKEHDEEAPLAVTGTHVHIHMPGEKEAGATDPAAANGNTSGTSDEEEGKEPHPMENRMAACESRLGEIHDMLKKLTSGSEEAEGDAEQQGEEEAEGDTPNADKEPGEEEAEGEKEPDKNASVGKDKKGAKDSAHLVESFKDALSGAEILAPGLKLPTFDKKADPKRTTDAACLLKRRALAAYARTDDGAEVLEALTGKRTVDGTMNCAALGVVFNGAVAMTKDRNTVVERGGARRAAKDTKPAIIGPTSFNDAMREHYKQQPLRPKS